MSYILNALRKSEQERQAIKPESITQRISIQQPLAQRNSTKLIAGLIICNLAVLAYFLIPKLQTPSVLAPQETPAQQTNTTSVKPVEVANPEPLPAPMPEAKPLEQQATGIAAIVAAKNTTPQQPIAKLEVVKKPLPVLEKLVLLPQQPIIRKFEKIATAKAISAHPSPSVAKNDYPYLEDLPADLRRSLPSFTINVFSYSSTPTQRFVMIDMVKYLPGQRIKDLLDLQEIREDCIVVSYNEATFKIRRP